MTQLSFEEYNFEVISIENPQINLLTINKNGITFDRSIANCLNFSSHIRPLLDRDNKIFAIQACRSSSSKLSLFQNQKESKKGQ